MPQVVTLCENAVRWFQWNIVVFNPDSGRVTRAPVRVTINFFASRQDYLKTKILAAKRYAVRRNLLFDASWAITPYDAHAEEIQTLSDQIDIELYNEGREVFILGGDPASLWHPMQQKGYQDGLDDREAMIQEKEAKPWL
jgi:hypothetical protein